MKVREHGLQVRERSRVYPSKPTCAGGQNADSVRWRDCYSAALILGVGSFVSIITFCVEKLVKAKLGDELRERIRRSNCISMSKLLGDDKTEVEAFESLN